MRGHAFSGLLTAITISQFGYTTYSHDRGVRFMTPIPGSVPTLAPPKSKVDE
jgi:hypothetical protein